MIEVIHVAIMLAVLTWAWAVVALVVMAGATLARSARARRARRARHRATP